MDSVSVLNDDNPYDANSLGMFEVKLNILFTPNLI